MLIQPAEVPCLWAALATAASDNSVGARPLKVSLPILPKTLPFIRDNGRGHLPLNLLPKLTRIGIAGLLQVFAPNLGGGC